MYADFAFDNHVGVQNTLFFRTNPAVHKRKTTFSEEVNMSTEESK